MPPYLLAIVDGVLFVIPELEAALRSLQPRIARRFRRFGGKLKQARAHYQLFETRQSQFDASQPSAKPQCGCHNQPAQGSEQADAKRNDGDQFRAHAYSLAASGLAKDCLLGEALSRSHYHADPPLLNNQTNAQHALESHRSSISTVRLEQEGLDSGGSRFSGRRVKMCNNLWSKRCKLKI